MIQNTKLVKHVLGSESSPKAPTRWILTGGSGFLGTNFLNASKPEDGEIIVLDRHPSLWPVERPWIRYIEQDVREVEAYRKEFISGSVVVHMASVSYPGKAEKMIESDIQDNILGTVRVAQAAADQGVRAFLFLSSGGAVYGDQQIFPIPETANLQPKSMYGVMKLANEHYLRILHQLRDLPVALLRIANPFGKWHPGIGQGAINVFLQKVLQAERIELWGDGEQIRDYIPVYEAVEAIKQIGLRFTSGCEAFNIGTGVGHSLREILVLIQNVTEIVPDVTFRSARGVDVEKNILDCSKMESLFGWRSTSPFDIAIKESWDWIRS